VRYEREDHPSRAEGERVGGVVIAPLAIVWRSALSVSEYKAAAKRIDVPEQQCPALRERAEEAVRMIAHNGGAVDRIEASHRPGGVSSHTYDHINYYTSSGDKAAVQVILSPKVEAD
jgi:hypothetical protein